jgi:hypothetical protein
MANREPAEADPPASEDGSRTTRRGRVRSGYQHFTQRMTESPEIFRKATGETLYPGTINVEGGSAGQNARALEDSRAPRSENRSRISCSNRAP